MLRQNPAKQWESFGRNDPYFGVCTDAQFQRENLCEEARARFFSSGEEEVNDLIADARSLVEPGVTFDRVLEYGCGVGRLLIPVSRHARSVVGVDISPSMLAEARRNCDAFGARNVDLVSPGEFDSMRGGFDFIYSIAVLQHVPRRAGEQIIARLAERLNPGGVGVINVSLAADKRLARFNTVMTWPLAHNFLNVVRGRNWSYPVMEMNVYDVNRVLLILRDRGARAASVKLGAAFEAFEFCTILFRADA